MFVSVIISTKDRAAYLSAALESLTRQTFPQDKFEVIVVDNGSKDNTRNLCASFADRIPRLRYLCEETAGLHACRHRGMKTAKADILVYADDDIEAFPTWLEAIAETFCDEHVVLVGGKNLPRFESTPPDWIQRLWKADPMGRRVLGFLSILDLGDSVKEISPLFIFGCNFSIRKKTIVEAGGFHPDSMPPELIRYRGDGETYISRFIKNRGYKAMYHPKASIYHVIPEKRMTVDYFCHRAMLQGISDSYTSIRDKQGRLFIYLRELEIMTRILFSREPLSKVSTHYLRGFFYHQCEVKKDPVLHDWVVKDTYLD